MKGVYFCDKDGQIARESDPYVTKKQTVGPYTPGGSYNY